ncbi:MAG: NAD-dependent epimerase/dehydratase family protein [Pseudomonadota bacterium]|nr:NAD-dependent epimerase/dehydratase family protein [Pseudomonadota bacterium]
MRILVTGVAGFIGFHVAKALVARGDTVLGIDNLNDYYDPKLKKARLRQLGIVDENFKNGKYMQSSRHPSFQFLKLDITLYKSLATVFENHHFDAVCHLAGQAGTYFSSKNPNACVSSNIVGFSNIIECVRQAGIKNFCYASSASVYGLNCSEALTTEHATNHPASLYAATKKSNELIAHAYSHQYGISTTGLRYFTVYGPWGRPDMAPMLFTQSILSGDPITLYNRGDMWRDLTYIDDVVESTIAILDKPATSNLNWDIKSPNQASSDAPYQIFNVGNNSPVRIGDFLSYLEKTLGIKANIHFKPVRKSDMIFTHADTSSLTQFIGKAPQTALSDGIAAFISWFKSYEAQQSWLHASSKDAS